MSQTVGQWLIYALFDTTATSYIAMATLVRARLLFERRFSLRDGLTEIIGTVLAVMGSIYNTCIEVFCILNTFLV